ncbi:hypothetical protein BJ875DRAFT_508122 [Amylocarpus encephaloides]|uniref:Uncharacterized protein n=1 Tax=Amylocarpus encephaloides TaxID=45428 RepID=A0A9P7Y9V6_9HELO|nr:hypothetical protein BJ875DRAFT_508122 [Amylocarpus encephaloides]
MLFNLAAATSLLAAAVSAAPTPEATTSNGVPYTWSVTGWTAGCARSCFYDFNITGNAFGETPTIPAFSAYCSGYDVGGDYKACDVFDELPGKRGVVAKLLPAETGAGAHIQVSLQWTDLEQPTVATYNQFSSPAESFTITPTEAWGVA